MSHPDIYPPSVKEIRWLTRGEFTRHWIPRQEEEPIEPPAALPPLPTYIKAGLQAAQSILSTELREQSEEGSASHDRKTVDPATQSSMATLLKQIQTTESNEQSVGRTAQRLGSSSSIVSFTRSFATATAKIYMNPQRGITIDGGPHSLWWPVQNADGSVDNKDVPIPQLLREMQPFAKFIVTISDPVQRMYSDYYFLGKYFACNVVSFILITKSVSD